LGAHRKRRRCRRRGGWGGSVLCRGSVLVRPDPLPPVIQKGFAGCQGAWNGGSVPGDGSLTWGRRAVGKGVTAGGNPAGDSGGRGGILSGPVIGGSPEPGFRRWMPRIDGGLREASSRPVGRRVWVAFGHRVRPGRAGPPSPSRVKNPTGVHRGDGTGVGARRWPLDRGAGGRLGGVLGVRHLLGGGVGDLPCCSTAVDQTTRVLILC
jgi:hypothetical protein